MQKPVRSETGRGDTSVTELGLTPASLGGHSPSEKVGEAAHPRQAVLGRSRPAEGTPSGPVPQELQTAQTLVSLVEPVLSAMRQQGKLRPDADTRFLAALLVDACLMSLLHGGHRNQREVLLDWQDRFLLLMQGALQPKPGTGALPPLDPQGDDPPGNSHESEK